MKLLLKRLAKLDLGLPAVMLLAVLALWPLLTRPSLPTFTDGEQHVYRTFEIMDAWRAGVVYLRWAPDLFHAYGYPVFNYYSPLTYYLAGAYGWFWGPVAGVKFVLVLSALVGAAGLYLFARDEWGPLAGLVAAAAYTFSPYLVSVDPLSRGDAPETLSLAVAPWLFWLFTRLLRAPSRWRLALAAVTLAVLILSHNLMAIIFFGWLLLWLGWLAVTGSPGAASLSLKTIEWRRLWPLGLALALGVGLAAFLWLPAVAERHAVQLSDAVNKGHLDFRLSFVPPGVMFEAATGAHPDWQLGLPQWLLAGLGIGLLGFRRSGLRRGPALFFAISALVLLFFMLPLSEGIWQTLPFMAFLQFPWRLLGPAALALSLLAGVAAAWAQRLGSIVLFRRVRVDLGAAISVAMVAACILVAMPLLDPLPWADFGQVSISRLLKSGLDWWPGTTASNEFLPVTVRSAPLPQMALLQSYDTGLVDKVDRPSLPAGVDVTVLAHGPADDRFKVTAPAPFTLRVYTFDFPGWTAYVDGQRTSIAPSIPEGWITLTVPGGEHVVWLRFEDTWPRTLGWILAGLSVLGLIGALVAVGGRAPVGRESAPSPHLGGRLALAVGIIFAGGVGLRVAGDQTSWWREKPAQVETPPAQHTIWAPLESNMALIGYDLPQLSARPGDHVPVTLYWEAIAPVTRNLRVFVHFISHDGNLGGLSDHLRPGGFLIEPTSRWAVFRYQTDAHDAVIDPAAAPGVYTVWAGLWNEFTGERMHTLDASGAPTDQDGVILTDSFVVRP
jgi:hypothetical protein